MYQVESYLRVRRAVMVEGMSIREASRAFGLHRDTVRKGYLPKLWGRDQLLNTLRDVVDGGYRSPS